MGVNVLIVVVEGVNIINHCYLRLSPISLSRYRYFPNRRGGVSGFGAPPTRRPAAQEQPGGGAGGGRHNWGQGFRLGGE